MALPLIFLDLDGTVIGARGVREAIWEVAARAREAGVRLAVCTGRTRGGIAQRIAARLDADAPHIFESGALVAPAEGDPHYADALDDGDLARLIAKSKETDAALELYTTAGIFVSRLTEDCAEHARVLEIEVEEADLEAISREKTVLRGHWIMRPEHVDDVLSLDLDASHVAKASSPVLPKNVFASVTRQDVSKGTAAKRAAELLGIALADVMAVGDSVGDVPILDVVGHPYVMGDGDEEILTRYPVLSAVDEDGVCEAIEKAISKF